MKIKKMLAVLLSILTITSCLSLMSIGNANAYNQNQTITWENGRYNANTGVKEGEDYGYCIRTNYIDVSNSKSITISYIGDFSWNVHFYDENKTFISSSNGQYAYATEGGTIKNIGKYITVSIYRNPVAPYYGKYITVKTDEKLKTTNEQIDLGTWEQGYISGTTGNTGNNTTDIRTNYFNVSEYTSITYTGERITTRFFWYDKDKNFISASSNATNTSRTLSVPDNAVYAKMSVYNENGIQPAYGDEIVLNGKRTIASTYIDTSKTGSLTIYNYQIPKTANLTVQGTGESADNTEYLRQIGATPLSGVTFTIKRIVDDSFSNNNGDSYYTPSGINLPDVNTVKSSLNNNDGVYTVYNTYTLSPTDNDGMATRSGLPIGIYLVQETNAPSSNIAHTADYLVSIPTTSTNHNSWNYDITTYPKTRNGVVLTYDPNNQYSSDIPFSENRWANKTEPLTENHFTATGQFFLGWADEPTAKTPKYLDKEDFTMPDEDKTIYAVWGYSNTFRYYTSFKYSEPWGLKLSFAMLNPKSGRVIDYSNYSEYGMYVYPKHRLKGNFTLEWENGGINGSGSTYDNTSCIRTKNYLDVSEYKNIKTVFNNEKNTPYSYSVFTYDKDKKFISRQNFTRNSNTYNYAVGNETIDINCAFIKIHIYTNKSNYTWTEKDNKRLNISVKYKTPSIQETLQKGTLAKKYQVDSLTFNDGNTDNYVTTIYDKDIYTQNLDEDIFAVPYVIYKGRIFWGTVKNRSVEDSINSIIETSQIGLTSYTEAEVKLATAIKSMFDAESVYYNKAKSTAKQYSDGKSITDSKGKIDLGTWIKGGISDATGGNQGSSTTIRTDYIDVSSHNFIYVQSRTSGSYNFYWYDKDKKYIGSERANTNFFIETKVDKPVLGKYVRFAIYNSSGSNLSYGDGLVVLGKQLGTGENKTFTHLTSLRAIEPWEMKLQAQPQEADFSSYDDYGVVTYTDYYNTFDKEKSLTYEDLINNDKCMLFSAKDGTCELETFNGSQFITATSENIYTYRLQQTNVYTCFYYIKDNKCYYSDIKKRNGLDMAKKVIENKNASDEISVAAADVATQMINLYRETYYYRNGKYPTDDYDGPVWYLDDKNLTAEATQATTKP